MKLTITRTALAAVLDERRAPRETGANAQWLFMHGDVISTIAEDPLDQLEERAKR